MPDCLISLGSNLGDRQTLLREAVRELTSNRGVDEVRTSRLYETPPVGGPPGQGAFLNAVATCRTAYSAIEILDLLQSIETRLGRKRAERWDARTIDLDIVLYGDRIGDRSRLNVPHPRFAARLFVLVPALDVASDWRDPRSGWTIERLVAHHRSAPPSVALVGLDRTVRQTICERLQTRRAVHFHPAPKTDAAVSVVANAPAGWTCSTTTLPARSDIVTSWVSDDIDSLKPTDSSSPRIIARLRAVDDANRWPALHDVWPNLWQWPEYVVEFENLNQAEAEIYSTLQSMSCAVIPASEDQAWWK